MKNQTDRRFQEQSSAFNFHLFFLASCGCLGSLVAAVFLVLTPKSSDAAVSDVKISPVEVTFDELQVLVPAVTIPPGQRLEARQFRVEKRPANFVPEAAVRNHEEIRNTYALVEIPSGQPLSRSHISRVRPVSQITAGIPIGFRAVAIKVNDTTSVEGWARAGSFVDVAWATRFKGKDTLKIVAAHVKVMSAERDAQPGGANPAKPVPSTVTLLVNPIQAMKIHLGMKTGELVLVLRGDGDHSRGAGMEGTTTTDDLLGRRILIDGYSAPRGTARIKNKDGNYTELELENGRLER